VSERQAIALLMALRAAVRQYLLYPPGHPALLQLIDETRGAADDLARLDPAGLAAISLLGDSIFLGPSVLPHASLEFNGLLRQMQAVGLDSITFAAPVSAGDVQELAAFAAGASQDLPAEGTIRLNERPFSLDHDEEGTGFGGIRRSYARSLDVLRGIALASQTTETFDLTGAAWAVEQLMEQSLEHPAASLLLATVRSHDEYTFYHSVNVAILSLALGRLTGVPDDQLPILGVAAMLHDIGKVGVSPSILQHPGRLSGEQWGEIKLHPQEGAQTILAAAGPAQEVASVVALEHHARFDGSGYPQVSYRNALHFYSRLVATTDTFDAITTRRSYRRAETPHRALRVLLKGSGGMYDPDFTRAFIKMLGVYPPGSLLLMENGEVLMVTQVAEAGELPAAVLVRTQAGELLDLPEPISLADRTIIDQLTPEDAGVEPAALLEHVGLESGGD